MKVSFEGAEYELDTGHMLFQHSLAVQKQTGMSIGDWEDSLSFRKDDDGKWLNPPPEWLVSVGALYWLMLAQNGGAPDPAKMDFDWQEFLSAYFEALSAELDRLKAEADPEPDPTPPSGTPGGPASSTPSTRTATTRKNAVREEGADTGS